MKTSISLKSAVLAVGILCTASFGQSWYTGSGIGTPCTYNTGGNVKVSGPRYSAAGDSAALLFGDGYARVVAKWGFGLRISTYGSSAQSAIAIQENTGNVGIGLGATYVPTSKLQVGGSIAVGYAMKAQSFTAGDTSVYSLYGGSITATLPKASTCPGRIYYFKNTASGNVGNIIATSNYDEFDFGQGVRTLPLVTAQGCIQIISNGVQTWHIIGKY